jgi:hypothetical protein
MTVLHLGIGVPPPLTPPHKGEGDSSIGAYEQLETLTAGTPGFPSPLWGGVRGGGTFSYRGTRQ